MAKYRKKPAVIDAEQFIFIDGINGPKTIALGKRLGLIQNLPHSILWEVRTLEGWRIVSSGNWIVTDARGEKYQFRPDVFEAMYEPVE